MSNHDHTILVVENDPYDAKLILRAIVKARITNPIKAVTVGAAAIDYLAGVPLYDDCQEFPVPVLMLLDF